MKFLRDASNDKLIDAISRREHYINLILKGKDRLPIDCTINELLSPSGINISDYQEVAEQVNKYIDELKKRNNMWYVIKTKIKIFINNIFNSKCPNCGYPLKWYYDCNLNNNIYTCDNCKKEYI